ncbi:hypothetical protein [Vibrio barjaei]|uniref:hypothetical protein n=1 Tax=Vibrio barjaei TaxID=1676683 RepID=UPI002283C8F0|nr:hypothetical protein [Vibrio barjaei]MCY9870506.1 hypothetical protein [Vibrio barjaei]
MKTYTGVGNRAINKYTSLDLVKFAFVMAFNGYQHRGGVQVGSDLSFHFGALFACEVLRGKGYEVTEKMFTIGFVPWFPFNGFDRSCSWAELGVSKGAFEIAERYHPNYANLTSASKKLMARNAPQVLGENLANDEASKMLVAYTSDGAEKFTTSKTGGTAQAIRMAIDLSIPVRNLGNPLTHKQVMAWVEGQLDNIDYQYDLDSRNFIDHKIASTKPSNAHWVRGDIAKHFQSGEYAAVLHCLNCQGKHGSGVAKALTQAYPGLSEVVAKKGRGKKLLGEYSCLNTDVGVIYNLYGQEFYGRDKKAVYLDYQALDRSLKKVAPFLRGKKVLIPMIGSGTANGCWLSISQILSQYTTIDFYIVR